MNYIPKICKMLGVEINEEFTVPPLSGKYRISNYGLQFLADDGYWKLSKYFDAILTGEYKIEKLPFKPQNGDEYWTVVWRKVRSCADLMPIKCIYWDDIGDHFRVALGLVYRTREEAEADKYKAFERVVKKTWEEW